MIMLLGLDLLSLIRKIKMDSKIKRNWVEALRSGKYTQSQGRLRTNEGFCCLGVLCDIVSPQLWTHNEVTGFRFRGEAGMLPKAFVDEVGIPLLDQEKLIEMNDGDLDRDIQPKPFTRIAEYIEDNL